MIENGIAFSALFFLAWTFGRNNFSNLFGAAIGTRMISFKVGIGIAVFGVIMGALFSSAATTQNVNALGSVTQLFDALSVSLSAGLVMLLLSMAGVPASLTQTTVGSFMAWNVFSGSEMPKVLIIKTVLAWIYTPFLAGFIAFLLFFTARFWLKKFPIRLLWRDHFIRIGLMSVGFFLAYAFGANNMGSLIGPYLNIDLCNSFCLLVMGGFGIAAGFICADRHVIRTVSAGMFPLTPLEALIVVFSSALTLFLFSSVNLKHFLTALSLPTLPLVPVPLTGAVIGAIIGVAASKGIEGLRFQLVGKIIFSWIVAPVTAGFLCYSFLYLFRIGGIK